MGGSSEVEYLDAVEDDPQKRKPDIRRAKELLKWEPKVRAAGTARWAGERRSGTLCGCGTKMV